MLAPPQLAATLNKRGGGPNSSSSSATSSHHNHHQHNHHQHLSHLTQDSESVHQYLQQQQHHQHHYSQAGTVPQQLHVHHHGPRLQPHRQSRSIEQQLYDLSIQPDTGVTNNNNNNYSNNYHHRHTYSLNSLNNSLNELDLLLNYNILSGGIKTLKVDNPKETQNPQTGSTASGTTSGSSSSGGGGGGGNGATAPTASTGTGNPTYQQSFYWLNKDPASRMLMDKAKQKREYIFFLFYLS